MTDLTAAWELLEEARRERSRGETRKYLELVKKSMLLSFRAGLNILGVNYYNENILKMYLSTPHAYRPSVGEPELEEFEFRYGLITSDKLGAMNADERFLDATMDLAERIYFWAESIAKKLGDRLD